MDEVPPTAKTTQTVIVPPGGWFSFHLSDIWGYRYLIAQLIYRDFVIYYKQTILGPLWWVLHPLFATGIFTVIFSMIAKISTDDLPAPLFYLSGLTLWNYFSQCLLQTSRFFLDNQSILAKVYFPRLVVPIAVVLSNLFKLALQLILFVFLYSIFFLCGSPIHPTVALPLLPLLILYLLCLGLGLGLLISSITTRYRDLVLAVPFLAQLWMFASAIVHPLSQVPEQWRFYFALNPIVPAVELFRSMTLGTGSVATGPILIGVATTSLVLLLGLILFSRAERTFADTI